jgi:hypothetical protein
MTRSRMVVLASLTAVSIGTVVALGAFVMDPARAAVGPMRAEGLALPADTKFVVGFDVQRFVQSPFYKKYSTGHASSRPQAFAELEAKTGLNPERDVDQVIMAGRGPGARQDGLVLVFGRFDRHKLGRAIETEGRKDVTWKTVAGTTVYLFNEGKPQSTGAFAFLDDGALAMGGQKVVEGMIADRAAGTHGLEQNRSIMDLLGRVKVGSTFWMVGDQSLLSSMPTSIPGAGGSTGMQLPALKTLIVTGDLDPVVSLSVIGDASDEAGAKNLADVVRGFVALAERAHPVRGAGRAAPGASRRRHPPVDPRSRPERATLPGSKIPGVRAMDDKGTLFTSHVAKESIGAIVRTADQLIVGQIHARPQKRLKDEMNHLSDKFIAITDARVYDAAGTSLLYETAFMLVSNAHIVSLTPLSAVAQFGDSIWGRAVGSPVGEPMPTGERAS